MIYISIKKPLLPVKSDFVFKLIFGDQRNVDILKDFLKSVLDIPEEEYEQLTIIDPHVKKESEDDKYGILDVKINTVSGHVINVEIQLRFIPEMKERTIYYQSKMVTEQISSGQNFSLIKRIVTIIITDYFFDSEDNAYHRQYRYRTVDGKEFTNLTEINTLELKKLPNETDRTQLWYWMSFIKASNLEDYDMLAKTSPQIKKAVGILKELSADERTRMLFEEREKARRDIESLMDGARKEGREEGREEGRIESLEVVAKKLLKMKMPIERIIDVTGFTRNEIQALQSKQKQNTQSLDIEL